MDYPVAATRGEVVYVSPQSTPFDASDKLPSIYTNILFVRITDLLTVMQTLMGFTIPADALYCNLWYEITTYLFFRSKYSLVLDY